LASSSASVILWLPTVATTVESPPPANAGESTKSETATMTAHAYCDGRERRKIRIRSQYHKHSVLSQCSFFDHTLELIKSDELGGNVPGEAAMGHLRRMGRIVKSEGANRR